MNAFSPKGFFNDQLGQKECTECPLGKFAPGPGSMACLDCMPGTFGNVTGMSEMYLYSGYTPCTILCFANYVNPNLNF